MRNTPAAGIDTAKKMHDAVLDTNFPLIFRNRKNLVSMYSFYNIGRIVLSNFLPIGIDPRDSLIYLAVKRNDLGLYKINKEKKNMNGLIYFRLKCNL
jgi:hypothetical protein